MERYRVRAASFAVNAPVYRVVLTLSGGRLNQGWVA